MSNDDGNIEGLKLIKHNANNIDEPDDPSYPFKLEMVFRAPGFLQFTFVAMHGGSEDVVVRGMTKEAVDELIEKNSFRSHPRLKRLTFTGPDGIVEQLP